ncbi:MAG: hypothetical protein ABH878_06315 [bacterium]
MSTLLDLVGSFVIGGLLLLMLLSVNANVSQVSTEDQLELIVQENLAELVSEIEYDFRKIGYQVSNPALAIISGDSTSVIFWTDIDNNGSLDSVSYSLGATSEVTGTVNPRDRILHRAVNGQQTLGSLGAVDFRLRYFDLQGVQTTNMGLVKSIEYYLLLESQFPADTTYARSAWTSVIRPKNL